MTMISPCSRYILWSSHVAEKQSVNACGKHDFTKYNMSLWQYICVEIRFQLLRMILFFDSWKSQSLRAMPWNQWNSNVKKRPIPRSLMLLQQLDGALWTTWEDDQTNCKNSVSRSRAEKNVAAVTTMDWSSPATCSVLQKDERTPVM